MQRSPQNVDQPSPPTSYDQLQCRWLKVLHEDNHKILSELQAIRYRVATLIVIILLWIAGMIFNSAIRDSQRRTDEMLRRLGSAGHTQTGRCRRSNAGQPYQFPPHRTWDAANRH